jgi:hypothetical protein
MASPFFKRIALVILWSFSLQTPLWCEQGPYFAPLSAVASGGSAAAVLLVAPSISYQSHLGISSNIFRGDFGESFMRHYFTEGGDLSASKKWYMIDPGTVSRGKDGLSLSALGRPSRNGIDGLFMQYDSKGRPRSLMVVESKFGSSQLGMTQDGRQMSPQWIRNRLEITAEHHSRIKKLWEGGRIQRSLTPPSVAADSKVSTIPLAEGKYVKVWYDKKSGSYVYYSDNPLDESFSKQLDLQIQFMDGAAKGKIPIKSRLFNIGVDNKTGTLNVKISEVDIDIAGNKVSTRTIETISGKTFSQLSPLHQEMFKKSLVDSIAKSLESNGLSANEAIQKADSIVAQAQKEGDKAVANLATRYSENPKWSIKLGLREGAKSGLYAAGIAAVFVTLSTLWQGNFSSDNIIAGARDVALTGGAVSAGVYFGIQASTGINYGINYLLNSPNVSSTLKNTIRESLNKLGGAEGVSNIVGGVTGGLLTSAILAYGSAILGLTDWKSANRMMLTGAVSTLAGAATAYLIMGSAIAFGTASTGTAIASLAGITATNAALALLGGGTVAAGGWGIAGGAVVLSGGTMLVVIGVSSLIGYIWRAMDSAEELRRIEALLAGYR